MAKARPKTRPARKTTAHASKPARRQKGSPEKSFTKSLIAHGQAVRLAPGDKLPAGATHELVRDDHGKVRAVRRRFSIL